ncbi:hypothetical protein rsdtw13_32740 [Clostridium sp. TW13]|uniref:Uncharacterized protein n=1 Tax=Inconstantimicrobium mannanitabidum TaxID=1604901 RepID=A0ACB5RG21_9CLOT|nr:hypothetical protein rsdtw13_32740 [Clostridium sp. TW13]
MFFRNKIDTIIAIILLSILKTRFNITPPQIINLTLSTLLKKCTLTYFNMLFKNFHPVKLISAKFISTD